MGIRGVDHIVVRVKDLEAGIATYRDCLGMELERTAESEAIGIKQAFFPLRDGGFLEVVARTGGDSSASPTRSRRCSIFPSRNCTTRSTSCAATHRRC